MLAMVQCFCHCILVLMPLLKVPLHNFDVHQNLSACIVFHPICYLVLDLSDRHECPVVTQ